MKKGSKIVLSIALTIICTLGLCLPFLWEGNNKSGTDNQEKQESVNKTRYEANYYATADEKSPAQGKSASYKGGSIFLESDSTFTMLGGTIQNHSNTYGGAIYISDGATFTMRAGTISNCKSRYGGAIYVESGGICNIYGGTITGNSANYGPSIYAEAGANITISDDAVIDNNTVIIETNVSISTDTIAVGDLRADLNVYYVDFGSYPQWYVGSDMNTTLESWYGTNSPTSVNTYVVRQRTWEAYEYTDGNVYARGLSLPNNTSYTYLNGEKVIASGSAVWFKVEPIRWIILNYEAYTTGSESELEIMSYLALTGDIRFYPNTSDTGCNEWVNSELRTWLNSSFYTSAFTSDEQQIISTTSIGNNITGNFNTSTSNTTGVATEDKVYCLSYWDLDNSNSASIFNTNPKKLCSPTDFALGNYCYKKTSTSYVTATYPSGGTCYYWTRSAGALVSCACGVNYLGVNNNSDTVTSNNLGVRPVLRLSI